MNKKWLYSLLSGVFAVGMLAACNGDMDDDPGMPEEGDDMGEEDGDI
ncbi:hypothetical protein HUG15_05975 [Salicibibacter cibarius]|uniref:Lipoprotein n=1 Tax=Salicibibacter cibarius TaxID=2743000 RepID=A0A7T7CAT7_9BACI|nr:hypothetical protein [Salicibibacter cibarius]QQK75200.1 hypothetical protein HUG15_05975 [Salicibibacter cibarius]